MPPATEKVVECMNCGKIMPWWQAWNVVLKAAPTKVIGYLCTPCTKEA